MCVGMCCCLLPGQVLRTNLYSCFNILRPVVKAMMKSGGGSIAFCSSAVAQHGIPNHEAIAAAKAGIVGEWQGRDTRMHQASRPVLVLAVSSSEPVSGACGMAWHMATECVMHDAANC
jgi:NAD(P)-dependent dehydrogenase (short-subunit alcohol dehydrogenase family)